MNTFVFNQNQTYLRYDLLLPSYEQTGLDQSQAYLSHNQFCPWTRKLVIHSTCKTLLNYPERYGSFNMALHIASGQYAKLVKSKQNLASFKMMLNHVLGCSGCLRRQSRLNFSYKWAFLAPGQAVSESPVEKPLNPIKPESLRSKSKFKFKFKGCEAQCGLSNIFVFELDHLDYGLFEFIHGLDLSYGLSQPTVKR